MSNSVIPNEYLENFSEKQKQKIIKWWKKLESEHQQDIGVLLDHRQDDLAYINCKDKSGKTAWHTLPIVMDDIPREEYDENKDPYEEEWTAEDFGYVFDTSEVVLKPDSTVRLFHVCRNHPLARLVIKNKIIHANFICPVINSRCPIQTFSQRGNFQQEKLLHINKITGKSLWLCD